MNLQEQLRLLMFQLGDLITHRGDVDRDIEMVKERIGQVRAMMLMAQEGKPQNGALPTPIHAASDPAPTTAPA